MSFLPPLVFRLFVILSLVTVSSCASGLNLIDPLPYSSDSIPDLGETPVDADGVHLYEREGVRHRHPVAQSQHGLRLLEAWRNGSDPRYLDLAILNATDLLAHADNGYLPYSFDFPLHGDAENTIQAPWYSAMAQGQFLSLAVRLHEATNDDYWLKIADQFFETLARTVQYDDLPDEPWVTFRDENGYLWLEEYAGDIAPMQVLNGHIFAMYGLYDYWRVTGSDEAANLFEDAAATVKHYVPQLRVPGEPSWYGMRVQDNPIAQSESYHRIHIGQLRTLAEITGERVFADLADQLESDFS